MSIFLFPFLPLAYLVNLVWDRYWRFRKPVRVDARVISVGNITVGGSGKTTLSAYIASKLLYQGEKTALVARGYGRLRRAPVRIVGGSDTSWELIGDEPAALSKAIPGLAIYIDSNKTQAARDAAAGGMGYIVIDDGFQHRRLHRDLDIVCLEGKWPFGSGLLLPVGRLREPPSSLARADALVAFDMSSDKLASLARYGKPVFHARKKVAGVKTLDGKPIDIEGQNLVAFCGLGNPTSFLKSLNEIKIRRTAFMPFRDHHIYKKSDIEKITERIRATGADGAITTAKDVVKLERLWPSNTRLYYLQIVIELDKEPEFLKLLGV